MRFLRPILSKYYFYATLIFNQAEEQFTFLFYSFFSGNADLLHHVHFLLASELHPGKESEWRAEALKAKICRGH